MEAPPPKLYPHVEPPSAQHEKPTDAGKEWHPHPVPRVRDISNTTLSEVRVAAVSARSITDTLYPMTQDNFLVHVSKEIWVAQTGTHASAQEEALEEH
eukprot:2043868-Amphidinium_carterae.1